MFILAASGSAVGLGNIWRFPYVAGENGGAAFVIVYLLCIFLIGLPIMIAEISLGRAGRQSPINSMRNLAAKSGASHRWQAIGWLGAIAGFMILSFYSVIAGWSFAYVFEMASGAFEDVDGGYAAAQFDGLTSNVWSIVAWHSLFMVTVTLISAR